MFAGASALAPGRESAQIIFEGVAIGGGPVPAARFAQKYRRERDAMILPWTDIQDFGTTPKQYAYQERRAEARLVAGWRNVALSPGRLHSG